MVTVKQPSKSPDLIHFWEGGFCCWMKNEFQLGKFDTRNK